MKALYILPVLAVLGLFSAADAATNQEQIDKFEAKIDRLEERIDRLEAKIDRLDPATDQKRIDRLEAKIDRLEERIDRLEAKIAELEAVDESGDAAGKADAGDASGGSAEANQGASYARSTYVEPPATAKQTSDKTSTPGERGARDTPAVDATVTITEDGRFTEDADTLNLSLTDRQFTVKFVNQHDIEHTLVIDLMSGGATHPYMHHASEDRKIEQGGEITETFTIKDDPRVTVGTPAYLVFGVANIPSTDEYEPDTITGDHLIKIQIGA